MSGPNANADYPVDDPAAVAAAGQVAGDVGNRTDSGSLIADADWQRYPVSFTGTGGEFFRIWIVNLMLSIVTLWIYSAWAKVRTMRYFAGNTVIDGSAFEYHATPIQILKGRLIAMVLLALFLFGEFIHPLVAIIGTLVFFAVIPWVIWRSAKFRMRVTSFRNVRFDFTGTLPAIYWLMLGVPLLAVVAVGVPAWLLNWSDVAPPVTALVGTLAVLAVLAFYPWWHGRYASYLLNGYRYGSADVEATISTRRITGIFVRTALLSLGAILAFLAVMAVVVTVDMAIDGHSLDDMFQQQGDRIDFRSMTGALTLIPLAAMFVLGYMLRAYFRSRMRGYLFAQVRLDERVRFESTLRLWPFTWLLLSNALLIVVTLGIAYPWTAIRLARHLANHTVLYSPGELGAVTDREHDRQSSLGEEIGEAFDVSLDVGF